MGQITIHQPQVQHLVAAKLGTAQATDSAKEDDPSELWNAVKRGSVPAEIALANLYLKGEAVPRTANRHTCFSSRHR